MVKNYHQVHEAGVCMMKSSYNSEYLFTADVNGNMTQWSVKDQREIKYLDRINETSLQHMLCSNDDNLLFTADDNGNLKQFTLSEFDMVKNYRKPFSNNTYSSTQISLIVITQNYLNIVDASKRSLLQISIAKKQIVFDYSELLSTDHPNGIDHMVEYQRDLFVSSNKGVMSQLSLDKKEV